jgi:hypothetical protein
VYLPRIINGVRETLCKDECLHRLPLSSVTPSPTGYDSG